MALDRTGGPDRPARPAGLRGRGAVPVVAVRPGDLRPSGRAAPLWIGVTCAVLLFAGFFGNAWRAADPGWFARHQRDSEGLVLGRLVKSRQDGLLSAAGFNGAGVPDLRRYPRSEEQVARQYETYLEGGAFEQYAPYMSQHGGQGMLFSVLDRLLPLSSGGKLKLFHALTALLSAIALSGIVVWFYAEFGGRVALAVALSMLLSRWLTVFGRNMWWSLWAFYLPVLATLYVLRTGAGGSGRLPARLGVAVFAAVLVKCFVNGYEYMTTTVVMALVPVVYYAVRDGWGLRRSLKLASSAAAGAGGAVVVSLAALCLQIRAVKGDLADGLSYVFFTLAKRTHGLGRQLPGRFAAGVEADTGTVLATYLRGAFVDLENWIPSSGPVAELLVFAVDYWHLVVVFLVASVVLTVRRRGPREGVGPKGPALIAATWFSILAPLSWLVVFKAHSHVHTHMNFLVWQMPFTFFGFALCGLVARDLPGGSSRPGEA